MGIFGKKSPFQSVEIDNFSPNLREQLAGWVSFVSSEFNNRIDTSTKSGQIRAYRACSILNSVISKKMLAIQVFRYWAIDENGDQIESPAAKLAEKRIAYPNPDQSFSEFIGNIQLMLDIFGVCYIEDRSALGLHQDGNLYILQNDMVEPVRKLGGSKDVEYYRISDQVQNRNVIPEKMIVIYDVIKNFDFKEKGFSRMIPIEDAINVFVNSYEAENELIVNRGALGIISIGASKDTEASIISATNPKLKDEKDAIQEQLKRYGILSNKFKFIVTNQAANFVPITAKLSDIEPIKLQDQAKKDIAYQYGISSVLVDASGATFSNLNEAKKMMYQDTIIPSAQNIFYILNKWYGFEGFKIMPFYDHVECMQLAKKEYATGLKMMTSAVKELVDTGIYTADEAKIIIETFLV